MSVGWDPDLGVWTVKKCNERGSHQPMLTFSVLSACLYNGDVKWISVFWTMWNEGQWNFILCEKGSGNKKNSSSYVVMSFNASLIRGNVFDEKFELKLEQNKTSTIQIQQTSNRNNEGKLKNLKKFYQLLVGNLKKPCRVAEQLCFLDICKINNLEFIFVPGSEI